MREKPASTLSEATIFFAGLYLAFQAGEGSRSKIRKRKERRLSNIIVVGAMWTGREGNVSGKPGRGHALRAGSDAPTHAPHRSPGGVSYLCGTARQPVEGIVIFTPASKKIKNTKPASIEPNERVREFQANRDA